MKIPEPSHTFRIYPGSRHGKYYVVQVFRTLKDMREHCHKRCHTYTKRDLSVTLASCHHVDRVIVRKGKRDYVHPHCGDIHLTSNVSTEVAIHECAHAAFYHVMNDKKPLSEIMDVDEPLAMAVGRLSRQMTIGLHEIGVWK